MPRKLFGSLLLLCLFACGDREESSDLSLALAPASETQESSDMPPIDDTNIVSIASGSPDHTTLVAALRAADYVTSVANPGPLTVFAPTNAAFEALPAGVVDTLMRPENLARLQQVLKHHVLPAVYQTSDLTDGRELGMVSGQRVTVHVADGKVMIGDATITATIRASNGIVHVIDRVLVPTE